MPKFKKPVQELNLNFFNHTLRGIEREALRMEELNIARTPHPKKLGHKLTHPNLTVDFAETLLEVITDPKPTRPETFLDLYTVLAFSTQNMPSTEYLWPSSMPPSILNDSDIQIAHFGQSFSGQMKNLYRAGLAARFGKPMQIIAGIHYNFSFPEYFYQSLNYTNPNEAYFHIIRNFHRYAWLLIYLFGSTPLIPKSSICLPSMPDFLQPFNTTYMIAPYGTSLRMGSLGYQSPAQEQLNISYRNLSEYTHDLLKATETPYAPFQHCHPQLNANILQIENEYYNVIRPKQPFKACERPITALSKRGVAYLELRLMDINPSEPTGIDPDTAAFLELFILMCLITEDTPCQTSDRRLSKQNFLNTSHFGRKPGLHLLRCNQSITVQEWGSEILQSCMEIAQQLDKEDKAKNGQIHPIIPHYWQSIVEKQLSHLKTGDTLSQQTMHDAYHLTQKEDYDLYLSQVGKTHTQILRDTTQKDAYSIALMQQLSTAVADSFKKEQALLTQEAQSSTQNLETYIKKYYSGCS